MFAFKMTAAHESLGRQMTVSRPFYTLTDPPVCFCVD